IPLHARGERRGDRFAEAPRLFGAREKSAPRWNRTQSRVPQRRRRHVGLKQDDLHRWFPLSPFYLRPDCDTKRYEALRTNWARRNVLEPSDSWRGCASGLSAAADGGAPSHSRCTEIEQHVVRAALS